MSVVSIRALDVGCEDLDEMNGCLTLRDELRTVLEPIDRPIEKICLDLSNCWLDYGFSSLYLDEALQALARSKALEKTLDIQVSIDLGDRTYMAALLFPQSKLLGYQAATGPATLAALLDEFCIANNVGLQMRCRIASADAEKIYRFGRGDAATK